MDKAQPPTTFLGEVGYGPSYRINKKKKQSFIPILVSNNLVLQGDSTNFGSNQASHGAPLLVPPFLESPQFVGPTGKFGLAFFHKHSPNLCVWDLAREEGFWMKITVIAVK